MNEIDLVKTIIAVVAAEAGFHAPADLLRSNREAYASKYRDDAVWLARTETELSFPELAKLFPRGKQPRHHTTIIAAFQRAETRRVKSPLRRDGRKWIEWHKHLLEKVRGACESSKPVT